MNDKVKALQQFISSQDPNGNYTQKDWLDVMQAAYREVIEAQAWTDAAFNFSDENTSHVKVSVVSYSSIHESDRDAMYMTDFELTPKQAKSMFLGIRDNYKGEK